ncbi:MAG: lysylphosphatidylglycerol synthase transmembrane domain-containing protein [Gammaproteobacteria bacterium]|nr:lysylphosphatidylglycerol synthase transmembrane domain-containing protein [Gammaproteobacteria bacterium]
MTDKSPPPAATTGRDRAPRKHPLVTALRYLIGALLLAGLILAVERWIGWSTLLSPWRTLAPGALAAGIILVFLSYSLRALRVYDYFLADTRGRFALCLRLSLQHNLLNNLLPMRSGELSFPLLMAHGFAIPAMRSVPALLWFRLLDLHTLIAFALLVLGERFIGQTAGALLGLAWMVLPWLGFQLYGAWQRRLRHHPGTIGKFLHQVLESLPQQPRLFWRSWLWTLLNWAIKLAVFAWILTLFADIPLGTAWIGATLGDFTSVLPIHGIAGAGTYEAGVVAGLAPFGIPPTTALQAAVNLHLFVLGCTLLSGLVSLLLPGQPLPKTTPTTVTPHE